jgi:hypothetical protein
MLLAKDHEESDSNYVEPPSEPSPEPKVSSTLAHSNSTLEDSAVPETSEPTRNGQEVNYVGEVCTPLFVDHRGEWIFVARATCRSVFQKNRKWYFKVSKKSEKKSRY